MTDALTKVTWERSARTDSENVESPRAEPAIGEVRAEVWLIIFSFLVIAVVARWPNWWEWITPEAAPARELSTALLLGVAGLSVYQLRHDSNWRWLLLGSGFLALAADERLALHESLADRVLAPRDVSLPFIPWGRPGDIVLVVVALAGLMLIPLIVPLFRGRPAFRRWFFIGVGLSSAAVAMDTLPTDSYSMTVAVWLQATEEIVELLGAGAFAHALLSQQPLDSSDGHRRLTW